MRGYFSFCGRWYDPRNIFCLADNLTCCQHQWVCAAHDRWSPRPQSE